MVGKGQLSIEFIMMMVMSFAVLFSAAYVIIDIGTQKNEQKTFQEVNNLGVSLQQEFLLASELEDGYSRIVEVPNTINGLNYTIVLGTASSSESYLELTFLNLGIVYSIPYVNGTIAKGDNNLSKSQGVLYLG